MELWTALVLGFAGSFHCVGMCGPIAMSIPRSNSGAAYLTTNAIIYNVGRILTYSAFGLLFGLLGVGITISGFQGALSIILGISILSGVIFSRFFKKYRFAVISNLSKIVSKAYGKLIRKESRFALFGMGILNGLLPCAFVYSGLAAAVLTVDAFHSTAYMALFGLGTFPAMFLMYLSPNMLSLNLRNSIRKAVPFLALGLGVFLIVRGAILQDLYLPRIIVESMENFCVFPGTR